MQEINRKRWSRSSGREKQKEDLNGRARPPDYREYQLSQKEWMQYLIMGAGAAGLCAYTFYRSVLAFLFLLPVAFLYPVYKKKDLKKERIRRLTLQFKEGIMVLASFLSAGYSLENTSEKYRGETSVHDAVPVMYLLHPEIFKGSQKILTVDCSEGSARGAVLGGFRWWQHEAEDANAFVLTEADKDRFREILITSLYELGQR